MLAACLKARKLGIDVFKDFSSPALTPLMPLQEKLFFRFTDVEAIKTQELDIADFGDLWTRMILAAQTYLANLPPDRLLMMRFEDVQSRPREELLRLIAFIDPDLADDAWLDRAAAMPRPAVSKYLGLDPGQRARLTKACAPGLDVLGYPIA